jgi:hypothetical protein
MERDMSDEQFFCVRLVASLRKNRESDTENGVRRNSVAQIEAQRSFQFLQKIWYFALLAAAIRTKTTFLKPAPESSGDEWRVENSQRGGTRFGTRHMHRWVVVEGSNDVKIWR